MTATASRDAAIRRAVVDTFTAAGDQPLSNGELYRGVRERAGLSDTELRDRQPVGAAGRRHSTAMRSARWAQQSLKRAGLIEQAGSRGVWRLTTNGKQTLRRIERGCAMVAFSTRLGVAVWCDLRDSMRGVDEPIHLLLTSPPYALAKTRGYDSPRPEEWVDFVCLAVEVVLPKLIDGGSICLNVGADTFEPGSPARRILPERLVVALHDRLGLHKMDTLVWHAPSKAPGPVQWASLKRVQLNVAWEPVLWLTNKPGAVRSDNRRVLQPLKPRHQRFIERGGAQRAANNSDGAYRRPVGAFSNPVAGTIPRNVMTFGTTCFSQRAYKAAAADLGLPAHGAPFPLSLARFLIEFLTEPGELVVDHMAGSITTGVAAEQLGRRWRCSDLMAEYLRGGATRFADVWINPAINRLLGLDTEPAGGRLSLL